MQKEDQPDYPLLYSHRGYRYNDLLLGQGRYEEVQRRAAQTLEWVERASQDILSAALDRLSLGRAYLMEVLQEGATDPSARLGAGPSAALRTGFSQAAAHLDQAVDGLRESGQQHLLPLGLLARAGLRRVMGDMAGAKRDLEEATDIADRGGMRLHQADCHLEAARLSLAQGQPDAARARLAEAKALIEDTGYHRRDGEVAELEAALAGAG
jgi:hypothetical protein